MSTTACLEHAESLLEKRLLPEALAAFNVAQAQGEDRNRCCGRRWMAHMLLGDFESAWRENDDLRARHAPDPHRFWQGEPVDGKRVIVRCLHGFGDNVQFLRYAPLLCAKASHLIVEVAPRFVELACCFNGIDEVITWGEHAPIHPPAWDVQIEIMELPYLFRTQRGDLPLATNYLHLPRHAELQVLRDGPFHIGMVASVGEWNRSRCIPPAVLAPLLDMRDVAFHSLEQGTTDPILAVCPNLFVDPGNCDSVLKLAQCIAGLDLIITADTLAAHLAGALGVPAWVMLQHAADWRWMHARTDSPWYPSLRLFRQPSAGDWPSVVSAIRTELSSFRDTRRCDRLVA